MRRRTRARRSRGGETLSLSVPSLALLLWRCLVRQYITARSSRRGGGGCQPRAPEEAGRPWQAPFGDALEESRGIGQDRIGKNWGLLHCRHVKQKRTSGAPAVQCQPAAPPALTETHDYKCCSPRWLSTIYLVMAFGWVVK